jgi:hypothetical protein
MKILLRIALGIAAITFPAGNASFWASADDWGRQRHGLADRLSNDPVNAR